MKGIQDLIELLDLERIEENYYRGQSTSIGSDRVFGGQVLAQALNAAVRTTPEDRTLHSLHAYFILPGMIKMPIIFQVDRIRDGGSFTTRRVKAIQNGEAIFLMAASFQLKQEGYDHQIEMPKVAMPENLMSWDEIAQKFGDFLPGAIKKFLNIERPIHFKPVELPNPANPKKSKPFRHVWMKPKGTIEDNAALHQMALAYTSDYNLLTTALLPHGDVANFGNIQLASLDHAMWFHRDFRWDDWLLYAVDSPSASNARGFTRGNIFSRDGKLIASVVQEGLIRPKKK